MGLMHVTVALKNLGNAAATYEADFLIDTGATDCLAPGTSSGRSTFGLLEVWCTNWPMEPNTNTPSVWWRFGLWAKSQPAA